MGGIPFEIAKIIGEPMNPRNPFVSMFENEMGILAEHVTKHIFYHIYIEQLIFDEELLFNEESTHYWN